jgi:hypothetical protein
MVIFSLLRIYNGYHQPTFSNITLFGPIIAWRHGCIYMHLTLLIVKYVKEMDGIVITEWLQKTRWRKNEKHTHAYSI